jgi:hypothetical protein
MPCGLQLRTPNELVEKKGPTMYTVHRHTRSSNRLRGRYRTLALSLIVAMLLASCGGDGKTSSGGGAAVTGNAPAEVETTSTGQVEGTPQPTGISPGVAPQPPANVPIVGPNLNGNWAGYYKSTSGKYENLRATITHTGSRVEIVTTKSSGVARELVGRIDAIGKMLLYDSFDNEDWTTLYGPASANSINLADFVFLGSVIVDTNVLILKR